MFKNRDEALAFVYKVSAEVPTSDEVESVICAPTLHLSALVKRQGDNLKVGAQNMHYLDEGAYTGEVSSGMLTNVGVEYVIVGHSERRAYYNETDESVNLKTIKALEANLTPLVCVGESLDVREAGTTDEVVAVQVKKAFENINATDAASVVVAYEPIWAIGTGKTASSEQANETIKAIRELLKDLYNDDVANKIRILYGGSVKPSNIDELLATSDIDGALVGGASLEAESFVALTKAAQNKK